ncbi:MAG TPA: helix-turn-helix domain-containing protein [Gaiellaceae bacterium]|nr:helix-turn-helix domain-containing protein [Gaiellaceae bacterium]
MRTAEQTDVRGAIAAAADIVGHKWTALILNELADDPRRFRDLEHACEGISTRTLAERLRVLEASGVVLRRSYPESPPRVEYELTAKGAALLPIVDEMRRFGAAWVL